MEAKQLSDSMRFSEKHLGVLLHYASILREQYGCEEEEKLAHEMMRSMYETYVEMLAHAPEYTDLNNTKSDPAIRQAVKLYRLHELTKKDMLQAADVYRQQRQEEVEALRDVSRPGVYSREQLTEAYKAAAQGAYRPQLNTEHPMSRGICLIDDREALERLAKS
jgi:prophage DNA circulation protein